MKKEMPRSLLPDMEGEALYLMEDMEGEALNLIKE